jgi:16S rRNA (guanine966-N2)-methyltransferase
MRIISGKYRGKRILSPTNLPVRPTTDMAKESLFNILNNEMELEGAKCLDLFAGTGNISFELASRGAGHITSVDMHVGCVTFIRNTAATLNDEAIHTFRQEVMRFLEKTNEHYDLIFADPPYDKDLEVQVVEIVNRRALLNKNGMMVIEHSPRTKLENLPGFVQHRKYGNVNFSMFESLQNPYKI